MANERDQTERRELQIEKKECVPGTFLILFLNGLSDMKGGAPTYILVDVGWTARYPGRFCWLDLNPQRYH